MPEVVPRVSKAKASGTVARYQKGRVRWSHIDEGRLAFVCDFRSIGLVDRLFECIGYFGQGRGWGG